MVLERQNYRIQMATFVLIIVFSVQVRMVHLIDAKLNTSFLNANLNNFYLRMNLLFAGQRERQMLSLKKKKINTVLMYNLEEMERKRQLKQNQKYDQLHNYQVMASQISESLSQYNYRSFRKKQLERKLLRDSYEKQIKDKQERIKLEKQKEREFFQRQKAFSDYIQVKRIFELQSMVDRKMYQGTPNNNHKRAKTQQNQGYHENYKPNPESHSFRLPKIAQKQQQNGHQILQKGYQNNVSQAKIPHHSLDNVFVETFQNTKGMKPKNFT